MAIAAQGLGTPRPSRSPGRAALCKVLDRIGTIQLDAVNVLARTQYLVVFSRVGSFDRSVTEELSGPDGPWFEHWGHTASLLPLELHPLFPLEDAASTGRPGRQPPRCTPAARPGAPPTGTASDEMPTIPAAVRCG